MLERFSFRQKIILLMAGTIAALVVLAALSVYQTREELVEGRKAALRAAVQSQASIVNGFQEAAKAGTMSEADARKAAADAVRLARYGDLKGKADYFFILSTSGEGIMHPFQKWQPGVLVQGRNKQGVDTTKMFIDAINASPDGTAMLLTGAAKPGDTDVNAVLYPKLQYLAKVPGWNWIVASGLYLDGVDEQVRAVALKQLAFCVVVLAAMATLSLAVTRSVLRQLGGDPRQAIAIMQSVAQGNLAVDLPAAHAGSLLDSLGRMVQSVKTAVDQVRESSDSINTASLQIAAGNQDLSVRTEQTASNLQAAASSMEELTQNLRHTATAAQHANTLAASAAKVAERGGGAIGQVVSTMDDINASSKRIADITGVIDGIAFQTNILALNASVEAARAGEQGRGFAVVADEVRNLAQRSAAAAREIKSLIGSSVEQVESGSRLVADAGATMAEIVAAVHQVSVIVGEISTAAAEQSTGIGQMNESVVQLDQMTQQNAALVEQSAAAAIALKDQAQRLTRAVDVFRAPAR